MEPIEIRPAYVFTCNECGRDAFLNGIIAEFSPEEMQELRDEQGVEAGEIGTWMTIPDVVACKHCGAEYETRHYSES